MSAPHATGHQSPAMSPARPAKLGCCVERTRRRDATAPSHGVHQPGSTRADPTTATTVTAAAAIMTRHRRALTT